MTEPSPFTTGQVRTPFRTVTVTPDGLVHLLEALGSGHDVRLCGHGIPRGVGVAGTRWDPDALTLEVDLVHHRWPDEIPPGQPIEIRYARRVGAGDNNWGAPEELAAPATNARANDPKATSAP